MELETESNSCIAFNQQTQKMNASDYYSNHTVTFGQDMSKFKQYHTPFNTFLQNNNIQCPNQQNQYNSNTNSQGSFGNQLQQTPYFQNNQTPQQGVNIFSQQNNPFGMQQSQSQQPQSGINIFASQNNNNQGINIFASQSQQQQQQQVQGNNVFSQQSNGNGFNVFSNIPQQQTQNNFMRNGVSLNQLANNFFPQVEVDMNKGYQAVMEQDEEGDGDYDPTENEEGVDEGDFDPDHQGDSDSSSGTSCDDEDPNELNDCLNDVDDKSFNLAEYLRVRDQL